MENQVGRERLRSLSPLVLRWAVGGVLLLAGWRMVNGVPEVQAPSAGPIEGAGLTGASLPADAGLAAMPLPPEASAEAAVSSRGVTVSANWRTVVAAVELGFGGVLVLGLLTRLAAGAGVVVVGLAGLLASSTGDGWALPGMMADLYEKQQIAVLLLGAVCLSLLVSGSGPLSLDRVWQRRRQRPAAALA